MLTASRSPSPAVRILLCPSGCDRSLAPSGRAAHGRRPHRRPRAAPRLGGRTPRWSQRSRKVGGWRRAVLAWSGPHPHHWHRGRRPGGALPPADCCRRRRSYPPRHRPSPRRPGRDVPDASCPRRRSLRSRRHAPGSRRRSAHFGTAISRRVASAPRGDDPRGGGGPPAVDPMNADRKFTRTRVRGLMPELSAVGLGAAALAAMAGRMAEAAAAIDMAATELLAAAITTDDLAVTRLDWAAFVGACQRCPAARTPRPHPHGHRRRGLCPAP